VMAQESSLKSRRKEAILAAAKLCRSGWRNENRVAAISPTSPEVIRAIIRDVEPILLCNNKSGQSHKLSPCIVLDAGCGDARWLVEISRHFNIVPGECAVKCVGVDINIDSALKYISDLKNETLTKGGVDSSDWLDSIELVMTDMFKNLTFVGGCQLPEMHSTLPTVPRNSTSGLTGVPIDALVESNVNGATIMPISPPGSLMAGLASVVGRRCEDGVDPHFMMPLPRVLVCYLSREGNLLLKNKLIAECGVSLESTDAKSHSLVLISVGVCVLDNCDIYACWVVYSARLSFAL
jgi:hypothetical protein